MTPEEKANYLVRKYWIDINDIAEDSISWRQAQKCALIAVNEILNALFQHKKIDYWKSVKDEIELL